MDPMGVLFWLLFLNPVVGSVAIVGVSVALFGIAALAIVDWIANPNR